MPTPEWHEAINTLHPSIVRISSPDVSGTGVFIARSNSKPLCVIATAAHVIKHAHNWELPIRIFQPSTGKSEMLKHESRAINIDVDSDEAVITFEPKELKFPQDPPPLLEKGYSIKPGVEIGWLGFPSVSPSQLCFFSGRISAFLKKEAWYLVDGVSINGVSGGPVFRRISNGGVELLGIITGYIPNRATGETLPGLAVVVDVTKFHNMASEFHSLHDAKAQETPPAGDAPPPVRKVDPTPIEELPRPKDKKEKKKGGSWKAKRRRSTSSTRRAA